MIFNKNGIYSLDLNYYSTDKVCLEFLLVQLKWLNCCKWTGVHLCRMHTFLQAKISKSPTITVSAITWKKIRMSLLQYFLVFYFQAL